ncbi:tetratricopeptide repeat protein [Pseudodesulfovibrio indicus]|uniref:Tetratricopeptide repeat protein n=1 Tax=Pseudodesulfovibrio indicus TaxID=1716143 RepID=A0A126QL20_9BACT|nr:tetratricopeptide repeat protein [Pseudodesulfovibrio indicus]AMK10368.1 hypothetical protein AWY79_04185 [Pseudodesulfovibrio indicus]TDT89244.1 tetratricopeptide repeat protein [Pseudodesulfovibrio indicus]
MKILILCLTLLLPCWATAGDIPQVCREAEALSGMPDANAEKELGLYEQCLKTELPPLVRASALFNMAVIYQDMGQWRKALEHYEASAHSNPEDFQAYSNMAWILATCPVASVRDSERALALAGKACTLSANLGTLDTYAAALARAGQFDKAASMQRKLVDQARQADGFPPEITKEMKERLDLYASGSPYTETIPSATY